MRYDKVDFNSKSRRLLPPLSRSPSLSEGGFFEVLSSADSGYGLLPDGAWTSTRYACPGRRASGKGKIQLDIFDYL